MVRIRRNSIVTAAILAVITTGTVTSRAQDTRQDNKDVGRKDVETGPRQAKSLADLSGVWQAPYVPDMTKDGRGQKGEPELPFTPAGEKEWKSYDATNGDYTGSCMPYGLSRSFNSPNPFQILQNSTSVAFLFEINNWFHVVPTDGRAHPKSPDPKWFGYSVGRWDGDTLVIDTVGFNGYTRLDTIGHPHSDALHLTQTLRRVDAEHIAFTVTVDDPKMYTRPWKNERTLSPLNGDLIEYSCQENNKDLREGHIKAWTPPWVKQ
jgi:hypothetical protein